MVSKWNKFSIKINFKSIYDLTKVAITFQHNQQAVLFCYFSLILKSLIWNIQVWQKKQTKIYKGIECFFTAL